MKKHVWFFNAHPDDINAGLALALVLRDLEEYQIHIVDFTRGERGLSYKKVPMDECAKIRTAEEYAVCAELNTEPVFLPQIDGESLVTEEVCSIIEKYFKVEPPAAVITHWPVDIHADHIMCAGTVMRVLNRKKIDTELYFYRQNQQSRNIPEDVFFPFDEKIMEEKCRILKLYACQEGELIAKRQKIENACNGFHCKAEYAECYASFQLPGNNRFFYELDELRKRRLLLK